MKASGHNGDVSSETQRNASYTSTIGAASRSRTHVGVALVQIAVAVAFICTLFFEASQPLSPKGWAFILLPPLVFGAAWYLGRRVRVSRGTAWTGALSRTGSAVSVVGFVSTALLVPVSLFGAWMDGIG